MMGPHNNESFHIWRILAIMTVVVILTTSATTSKTSLAVLEDIPGRPQKAYVRLGDINIGAIFAVSQYSTTTLCGDGIRFPLLQQYIEAMVFAIDVVNKDDSLLPNITLGFAILDDCTKESAAVAQALRFLPATILESKDNSENKSVDECSSASISHLNTVTSDHYDVIGVIGPLKSSNSIAVSYLLGAAHVPQLSFLATSDELSQKEKHPYFLRVVPPDAYQMRAIVEFIVREGWTYFSIIYSSGSYGEMAASNIKRYASSFSLCIATQHKLLPTTTESEYKEIVQDLLDHPRARVVVLVSGDAYMKRIFQTVYTMDASGKFIWIGTDGWAERISTLPAEFSQSLVGSFTTSFYAPTVPEFKSYFKTLKPSFSDNPWFSEFWERQFHCSFESNSCNETQDITTSDGFEFLGLSSYAIDSVYVYSHALHNLIKERCPLLTGREARNCVTGDVLLQYLKNVSFTGYTGNVMFDEFGNLLGKYVLKQIRPGHPLTQVPVKILDVLESYQMKDVNTIVWDYVKPMEMGYGPNARFPKPLYPVNDTRVPMSVCSRLCEPGEQIVYMEQACCWQCRKCRENERLVNNMTRCQKCPEFFWPDSRSNFTTCLQIEPDFPDLSEAYVILILSISMLGVVSSSVVIVFYVIHREVRVIKASSRELSYLQLSAILLGYTTTLVYLVTPTPASCSAAFYMFCLSFNWLYAPLLVKTIRIYRIFDSGRKGTRPLMAISPLSQVLISLALISGQIAICVVAAFLSTPTSRLTHKIRTERYVELSCDLTTPGLTSFLAYNLTLVLLCSVFAFKTRKLPANFNESRFISMCVSTTLVIWLAFVPAYVTSSREYLKGLYLSLALLLNHSVALIFLFVTRLYAVYYVDEVDTESRMAASNVSNFRARTRNSVAPASTPVPALSASMNHLVPGGNEPRALGDKSVV